MKRPTLMKIGGILFIIVSIAVVLVSIFTGVAAISPVACPFLFTGIIILYSGIDEARYGKAPIVEPQKEFGKITYEAQVGKRYVLPFFLILFGTVVLAIAGAILFIAMPAIGIVLLSVNVLYGLILNIYFINKLRKKEQRQEVDKQMDELAFKVAFFFASLATGGLFALGYLIYKKIKKK